MGSANVSGAGAFLLPEEALLESGAHTLSGVTSFELIQPDKNQTAAGIVIIASSAKLEVM
jgi:hypothetical protein